MLCASSFNLIIVRFLSQPFSAHRTAQQLAAIGGRCSWLFIVASSSSNGRLQNAFPLRSYPTARNKSRVMSISGTCSLWWCRSWCQVGVTMPPSVFNVIQPCSRAINRASLSNANRVAAVLDDLYVATLGESLDLSMAYRATGCCVACGCPFVLYSISE